MDSIVVDGNETIDIAKEEFIYYGTIDAVFLLVDKLVAMYEKELNSGTSNMKGVKIEVQHDDELHYPTEIKCVGYYKEVIYGGEYFEIAFSDFEVKQ